MIGEIAKGAERDPAADPGGYAKAILNILGDFSEEKARLQDTQKAILNILGDAGAEKLRLEATEKAVLNILADFSDEKARLADVQKGDLNILEDFAAEKARLESTQKAVLNILEDFDTEKNKVEQINREMAREIAERKLAEEALEAANKELEAFSYSVSHDLRAPLRAIDGFGQALLEDYAGRLDAEGRNYLERVRAGAQRMGTLIDDLLKLSRVTRAELNLEEVNLSVLAQEIAEGLRWREPQRQVEFDISPGLRARADARLLRIALENLLGNAWKFTGRRAEARIEFGATVRDGRPAYFVRDNGAGFDMAYAGKLFGAFQRLHGTTEFPGTGIGLATVQRVIHKHGGLVWAEGAVDQGATFYFTL